MPRAHSSTFARFLDTPFECISYSIKDTPIAEQQNDGQEKD